MAARLKVFVTSDGFTDHVVATASRAKALAAWGARQDLFASGGAYETDDPELIEAAVAQPGVVLRHPRRIRSVKALDAPRKAPLRRGPTKADRDRVKALEGELSAAAAAYDIDLAALEAARATLDLRRRDLEARYLEHRRELRAALAQARAKLE